MDLTGDTDPQAVEDTWYQVRKKVGDMRHTLPQGLIGPGFNDEFGDTYGIIYGFTADGFTHRELRDYVETVRSKLLRVPDVAKVSVLGAQDERIFVEFDMRTLAGLGFDPSALVAALAAQNVVRPTGVIQTGDESISLRVSGSFRSEADLLAVNFAIGERMLRLGDIAQVRRGLADPPQPMFRVNGQDALGLAIVMRDGGDILALGESIRQAMQGIVADLPIGIEAVRVADQPQTVDAAINDFTTSLWQAIAIILAVSFLSLGVRAGTVVALAIPLVLTTVFAIMNILDIDLQRISLGALIIALALLVDDAMTTVDAMSRRLAIGEAKEAAATYAYRTLAFAMLTGTLVTIAGFVPVGFAASSAGEYTFDIFAVVGITLLVSWFVAVVFAPLLGMLLLVPPKTQTDESKPGALLRAYRALLNGAIRLRWLTIAVTAAAFAVSLWAMDLVPRQFFPASDRTDLLVDIRLPQNASIHASAREADRLDAMLGADPDVAHWSTYVGWGAVRFYLPLSVQLPNPFFTQAVVVAKDLAARERLEVKLDQYLKEEVPQAITRVAPLELGPPVGWPIQYRVLGDDLDQLREIALELGQIVAEHRGTRDLNFDWMEPGRQLRIRIDQDQVRRLGLSSAAVASVLNTHITGTTVTQVRDDIYLIDVVAREREGQRVSFATLRTLEVPLPDGRTVPLDQLASFDYGQEYPMIWRRDRVPTLTVQADVAPGLLPDCGGRGPDPGDRGTERPVARGLLDRGRRLGGGERHLPGLRHGRGAPDAPAHDLAADVPTAEVPPAGHSPQRRAPGVDRGGRGPAPVRPAPGVRRHPRGARPDRHDRQELGHPDQPDRAGARDGQAPAGGGGGRQRLAPEAHHAHGPVHHPGAHPHSPNRVLGTHGLRHHGRPAGGDAPHPGLRAGALCHLVQGRTQSHPGGAGQGPRTSRPPPHPRVWRRSARTIWQRRHPSLEAAHEDRPHGLVCSPC